jgi:hypothetical protein
MTKTVVVTTTTYTRTLLSSPTKPMSGALRTPRVKSIGPPGSQVIRSKSLEPKAARVKSKSQDAGFSLVFPNPPSVAASSVVPTVPGLAVPPPSPSSKAAAKQPLPSGSSKAKPIKYAFPRPAPFPAHQRPGYLPSNGPSVLLSNPPAPPAKRLLPKTCTSPPHSTFARRYSRIPSQSSLAKARNGIDVYYVVLCGQEVGVFYSL